jgi:hypothetical protein
VSVVFVEERFDRPTEVDIRAQMSLLGAGVPLKNSNKDSANEMWIPMRDGDELYSEEPKREWRFWID